MYQGKRRTSVSGSSRCLPVRVNNSSRRRRLARSPPRRRLARSRPRRRRHPPPLPPPPNNWCHRTRGAHLPPRHRGTRPASAAAAGSAAHARAPRRRRPRWSGLGRGDTLRALFSVCGFSFAAGSELRRRYGTGALMCNRSPAPRHGGGTAATRRVVALSPRLSRVHLSSKPPETPTPPNPTHFDRVHATSLPSCRPDAAHRVVAHTRGQRSGRDPRRRWQPHRARLVRAPARWLAAPPRIRPSGRAAAAAPARGRGRASARCAGACAGRPRRRPCAALFEPC